MDRESQDIQDLVGGSARPYEQGCTAVLLACTDFGLAFGGTDAAIIRRALPLYDTGVLHALAAVELALASR